MDQVDFKEIEKEADVCLAQKKPSREEIEAEIADLGPAFQNTELFVATYYLSRGYQVEEIEDVIQSLRKEWLETMMQWKEMSQLNEESESQTNESSDSAACKSEPDE